MSQHDDLFPLKLSDFETYAFRDDSRMHPMVIVLRTSFEGCLDSTTFLGALQQTLSENPLLRCRVDASGWLEKWRLIEDFTPQIDVIRCDEEFPSDHCEPRYLDLTKSSGVQFELRLCARRGCLISYFHHACVDGLGAIRFLGDVFARYGAQTAESEDQSPIVRSPDPSLLLLRNSKSRASHQLRAPLRHTIREACRLFFRHSYRMQVCAPQEAANSKATQSGSQENIMHSRVLPRATLKALRQLSSARRATLNDLCLMAFIQQMAVWSEFNSQSGPDDLFRVLMPVSMRTPRHDDISAANVVSYVFHSYRRHQIQSAELLLEAVRSKSSQMLSRNEGAAMLHGFAVARRIPWISRLSRWIQPDFATAALSNVGEVRRIFQNRFPLKQGRAVAGNIVIHRVDGIAPVRENTNLTVAFGTYGGELMMHLNRNIQVIDEATAESFLEDLCDRLYRMADTGILHQETCRQSRPEEEPVGVCQ